MPALCWIQSRLHDRQAGACQPAHKLFPWVHITLSNLKRFLLGTHHQVERKHLKRYVAEFNYRLNRSPRKMTCLPGSCALASPHPPSLINNSPPCRSKLNNHLSVFAFAFYSQLTTASPPYLRTTPTTHPTQPVSRIADKTSVCNNREGCESSNRR
jgi:hypothetical protein